MASTALGVDKEYFQAIRRCLVKVQDGHTAVKWLCQRAYACEQYEGVQIQIQEPASAVRLRLSREPQPCSFCNKTHDMLIIHRVVVKDAQRDQKEDLIFGLANGAKHFWLWGIKVESVVTDADKRLMTSLSMTMGDDDCWYAC